MEDILNMDLEDMSYLLIFEGAWQKKENEKMQKMMGG